MRRLLVRVGPAVVVGLGVAATVGVVPALAGGLLALVVRRPRAQLTAALVLLVAVVPLWFLGSTLPLEQAAPRVEDNVLAPAVAGVALWLLSVAVVRDAVPSVRGESRDGG